MHLFPATGADMPAWASEAYEWSECLVFESDPPTILPFLKSTMGPDLQNLLSAEVWTKLHAVWPTNGRLPSLHEMRPWAALLIAPTLYQQLIEGIEPRFLRASIEESKSYRFLETAEEIAASLELVEVSEIQAALSFITSDPAQPQRMLHQMYDAWQRRDIEALYTVASQSPVFRSPAIRSAVLESRNLAWIPSIRDARKSPRRTLVVVGALHLCGPGNLIECLGLPIDQVAVRD